MYLKRIKIDNNLASQLGARIDGDNTTRETSDGEEVSVQRNTSAKNRDSAQPLRTSNRQTELRRRSKTRSLDVDENE